MIGKYDVLVIGTGFAGLGAGLKLRNSKRRFKLLDAASGPGGRVRSITTPVTKVIADLGATWLHGRDRDPLVPFARMFELELRRDEVNLSSIHNGTVCGAELRKAFINSVEENFIRARALNKNVDGPLEAFIADPELSKMARYRRQVWSSGDAPDSVSTRDFLGDPYSSGGIVFKYGMSELITEFANVIQPENIRYQTEVQYIEDFKNGVRVTAANTVTGDEEIYDADKVIFTGSIGFLKKNADEIFDQDVSDKILARTAGLNMGQMAKIYFELRPDFMDDPRHHNQHVDVVDQSGLVHAGIGGKPLVSALFGGEHAVRIDNASEQGKREAALAVISELRHVPHLAGIIEAMANGGQPIFNSWGRDPYALGAYSICRVGAVRPSAPVQIGNVILAGEAFSTSSGHVSGAFCSGNMAAKIALKRPAKITPTTSIVPQTSAGAPVHLAL